jgi:hypothetical protein
MNNLQNFSSDIVLKIMDYIDVPDLESTSKVCKNLNNDCEKFSKNIKHSNNLQNLIEEYTCRFCEEKGYDIHNFCTDCYLHMCENCYTVRNYMNEFIKKSFIDNLDYSYKYKKLCHDYCIFRCFNCKMFNDRHQLYLNNEIEMKSVCVDCFCNLDENEKQNYTPALENPKYYDDDEWDLDALD